VVEDPGQQGGVGDCEEEVVVYEVLRFEGRHGCPPKNASCFLRDIFLVVRRFIFRKIGGSSCFVSILRRVAALVSQLMGG
jgi:hypothetical protein